MKKLILLCLFSLPALAGTVKLDGIPPTKYVDGTPIKPGDIPATGAYTVRDQAGNATTHNGFPMTRTADPGEHRYSVTVKAKGLESAPSNAVTAVVPAPPATQYPAPTNFRIDNRVATGSTVAGVVNCTKPAGAKRILLFIMLKDGKLGSRLGASSQCGFSYPKFIPGRQYVLKAEYSGGKQSARSGAITI